jgi:hypothetical protein
MSYDNPRQNKYEGDGPYESKTAREAKNDQPWTPGQWQLETVPTQVGICHKIGPFPSLGVRDQTSACIYVDSGSLGRYEGIPGELYFCGKLRRALCLALRRRATRQ